jgi:hypothetical protein
MDLAARRLDLERDRQSRLRHLGVSEQALDVSVLQPIADRSEDSIRLLTWNLLADGMSDDGFLVNDVLQDWPAGRGNVPTADGEVVQFHALLNEMMAARGNSPALEKLKSRYHVPLAEKNAEAIVDWPARELQIQLQVLAAGRPDFLVFQECDHFGTLRQGLAKLGYRSSLPTATKEYEPAHLTGYNNRTPEGASEFQQAMESKGYAFLPNVNSTSMNIQLNSKDNKEKVLEAARTLGIENEIIDGGSVSRKSFCGRGSRKLLAGASIDPMSIDDDGVAIFWREDRFVGEALNVRLFPGGNGGALQIRLRELSYPSREILAIGAHLSSGDDLKSEERRITEQVDVAGGLREMVQEAASSDRAVVLCMDANSFPQIGADSGSSVWRSLHGAMGASVWDDHFDCHGNPSSNHNSNHGMDPPVTSNKLRGPLSGQAKKIGLHSYYCIDHIFFNPSQLKFQGHPLPPRQFASDVAAREVLCPNLSNPSDHYPVLADLAWPLKGGAHRMKVAAGKPVAVFVRSAISLLEGTEDQEPVKQLYISGLGAAIGTVTAVAQRLERDGHGTIERIYSDYPEVPNKGHNRTANCPRLVLMVRTAKG